MSNFKKILLYIGIPLVLALVIFGVMYSQDNKKTEDYSTIVEMVRAGEVSEFKLNLYDGKLTYVKRADGTKHTIGVASADIFYNDVSEAVLKWNESNPDN